MVPLFHPKYLRIRAVHTAHTFFKRLFETSGVAATGKVDFDFYWSTLAFLLLLNEESTMGAGSSSATFHNIQNLWRGRRISKKPTDIFKIPHIFSVNVKRVKYIKRSGYNVRNSSIKKMVCRHTWWCGSDCLPGWHKALLSAKFKWQHIAPTNGALGNNGVQAQNVVTIQECSVDQLTAFSEQATKLRLLSKDSIIWIEN